MTPQQTTVTEVKEKSLLDRIAEEQAVRQAEIASRYMPVLTTDQFAEREALLDQIVARMVKDVDYVTLPGQPKPFLSKAGAEKVCALFGYVPRYVTVREIEDWDGRTYGEPLFYYRYSCQILKDGKSVGEGEGSANSWESKYRYRWVKEDDIPMKYTQAEVNDFPTRTSMVTEFAFAIDKGETGGQYGKAPEYWQKWRDAIQSGEAKPIKKATKSGKELDAWEMGGTLYRIPNDQFADVINTCQKMGQKRSHVAATLSATGLSSRFSQDLEDLDASHVEPTPAQEIPRAKPEPVPSVHLPENLATWIQDYRAMKAGVDKAVNGFLQDQLIISLGKDAGPAKWKEITSQVVPPNGKWASREQAREATIGAWIRIWSVISQATTAKQAEAERAAAEQAQATQTEDIPFEDEPSEKGSQ